MLEVTMRPAQPGDIDGITTLINEFAMQGLMLPKTPDAIAVALDDFVVGADEHGRVVACGALREYSPSLAEVSSLAVSGRAHGRGLGRRVVAEVERLARLRGIAEVFALTLAPEFFRAVGYSVVERGLYPEKIRRDCAGCSRRFGCAEITVQRSLDAYPMEVAA